MIHIKNARSLQGDTLNLSIQSYDDLTIDASSLTVFPGLIDPHVHFRTPGMEHKEDWRTAARASIAGGYTTVFDMPNTLPPTITEELLIAKKNQIEAQLAEAGIPLRYQLFFGADKAHFNEIPKVKNAVVGIKVFMGCSTGNLVIDDDESLATVFEIAAKNDMLVAVHAEDEKRIHVRKHEFKDAKDYHEHSIIRDPEVALIAVEKAIGLTKKFGTRLYILHVSTRGEIELIAQAKQAGLPVFAETTPHHLFLDSSSYASLQGRAVVNPPLRSHGHQAALLKAINDGIIDTIGSDHAPHTLEEKSRPFGACPSGMPGIETTLPLLLTAYQQKLLSLEKIISITSQRAQEIFRLPKTDDIVLVDLNKQATVDNTHLQTKCKWSPYAGRELTGWPVYTIVNGKCFDLHATVLV